MVNGSDGVNGQVAGIITEQGLVRVATAVNDYARVVDLRGSKPVALGHRENACSADAGAVSRKLSARRLTTTSASGAAARNAGARRLRYNR